VREIKLEIFEFFRPLIPSFQRGAGKKVSEAEQIEEEYKYYFEGK